MVDRGKEFLAEFKAKMENDYRIQCNSISVRNPLANAIVNRVHQTIVNILCTFKMQKVDLEDENPLGRSQCFYNVQHKDYGAHYYTTLTITTGL